MNTTRTAQRKRDRKGRFVRSTCDLCRRPTRFVGYNRIPTREARLRSSLTWSKSDYTDFQCGCFCKQHGKQWLDDRHREYSYSHRLIMVGT